MWIRCRNFITAKTNEVSVCKFMTYALDRSLIRMKKQTDQYVFIFDLEDIGYQNFDMNLSRKMVPII